MDTFNYSTYPIDVTAASAARNVLQPQPSLTPAQQLQRYKDAGYSFFHLSSRDKSAMGAMPWKIWQNKKPDVEQIATWLQHPIQNYAIVCGEISGIVVIDVDTKNGGDPAPFLNRGMYEARTPSGGYHFYVRYDPLLKNSKQTKRKPGGILRAVDIQSTGSIVFAAPTVFKQGAYTVTNDAPIGTIPDDLLAQIVAELQPEQEVPEHTPYILPQYYSSDRPGDIYNALATWDDVLLPSGWNKVGRPVSGVQDWRRPGKNGGISASTNYGGHDLFYCFSSSVDGVDPGKGYTKFSLYTALNHAGDHSMAAKALRTFNYKLAKRIN